MKKSVLYILLILVIISLFFGIAKGLENPNPSLSITVIDAITGKPVQNATVLVWDISAFITPKPGFGIYLTDENGKCFISGDYLKIGHTYRIYTYKGDFKGKVLEYVPVKYDKDITFEIERLKEIVLRVFPGALVELEGIPYIVQSSSPEERYMVLKVIEVGVDMSNYSYIREYGNTPDAFFLCLDRKLVAVPANVPFRIEVRVWFPVSLAGYYLIEREIFTVDNNSLPFILPQGGYLSNIKLADFSLKKGLAYINSMYSLVSSKLDEAQNIGFTVFEERQILLQVSQKKLDAEALLKKAKAEKDYEEVWLILRDALGRINYISFVLQNKYLIGKTNAVYLSAVIAVFSIVLASFFFEENRKKMISSVFLYICFLGLLYIIHPGSHVIIDENLSLFLQSALISFAVVLGIVFGIPRVWKERTVEGEVQWRSALSIIFSMGKRNIKRKKIRGFFTILAICILILSFTSLTSFGTVFGIVSTKVSGVPPSEGILIRRMINGSSLIFMPLGYRDVESISRVASIINVAIRFKNAPSTTPIACLVNPNNKKDHLIYGVLAISPATESFYTKLHEVTIGGYLSEDGDNEVLISSSLASKLGVRVNDTIILEVSNTIIREPLIVKGIFSDDRYNNLVDIDGNLLGPSRLFEDGSIRRCNSTETVIINVATAKKIQSAVDGIYGRNAPQFVLPSEILFRLSPGENLDNVINKLIFLFGYDVFVSRGNEILYYYIGAYFEFKGVAEMLIPMVMVILNVSMVMINSAYERSKEIRVLSTVGLNPTHIGLTFVAEAVVLGMVGGSVGYLAGLGFYRTMIFFGQNLAVREKLEWWWSALGFILAIIISVLSAMRPAAMAVSAFTPSKIKRVKVITEEEKRKRREEIFRAFQARELSMPVKVLLNEKEFFVGFLLTSLNDLKSGYTERVENIREEPEIEGPRGELVKTIKFVYLFGPVERRLGTKNSLIMSKHPKEDYYRVRLVSEPLSPGMPESAIERTVEFTHSLMMQWARDKKRIMGESK